VLNEALEMLVTPYRYGGHNPHGFDCSGLVYYSHQQAGIRVPRTAEEQRLRARPVALDTLRPGDLLFFRLAGRKVNHVGIYAGDGRFVHAPSSGKSVSMASLNNPYWERHLIGAGSYY
jgi:cell wall-associated NlpC family hydrolase